MSNADVSKLVRDFETGTQQGNFSLVYADILEMKNAAGSNKALLNREMWQANCALVQDGAIPVSSADGLPQFILVDVDTSGHLITANPQTRQMEARDLNLNVLGTLNGPYGDPHRSPYPQQNYQDQLNPGPYSNQSYQPYDSQNYYSQPQNQGYQPYDSQNYYSQPQNQDYQPYHDYSQPVQYGDSDYQSPTQTQPYSSNYSTNINQGLTLDPNNLTDRIVQMLSASEGGLQSVNWNDVGQGISVGPYQANQNGGPLLTLFQAMYAADPGQFQEIFRGSYVNLLNQNSLSSLHFAQNNQLGQQLQQALTIPTFQQVELNLDRQRVNGFANEAINNYGVTCAEGIALYCYMMNWGPALAQKYFAAARNQTDQNAKIQAVMNAAQSSGDGTAVTRINATLARADQLGLGSNQTQYA